MSYGVKYNTSSVDLGGGLRVCKFCGNPLTHYEDRMGFDYREDGDHYYSCECDGAKAEQEKIAAQRALNLEIETFTKNKQQELDAKFQERMHPTFDERKMRYEMKLAAVHAEFINDAFDS